MGDLAGVENALSYAYAELSIPRIQIWSGFSFFCEFGSVLCFRNRKFCIVLGAFYWVQEALRIAIELKQKNKMQFRSCSCSRRICQNICNTVLERDWNRHWTERNGAIFFNKHSSTNNDNKQQRNSKNFRFCSIFSFVFGVIICSADRFSRRRRREGFGNVTYLDVRNHTKVKKVIINIMCHNMNGMENGSGVLRHSVYRALHRNFVNENHTIGELFGFAFCIRVEEKTFFNLFLVKSNVHRKLVYGWSGILHVGRNCSVRTRASSTQKGGKKGLEGKSQLELHIFMVIWDEITK